VEFSDEMQTDYGMDARDFVAAKQELRSRLAKLTAELDGYLAGAYSVYPGNAQAYDQWRKDYQPFHWFAEFYGIMGQGGFDVIIGNPPWREYAAVRRTYQVRGYTTEACGNLHGICTERALALRSGIGRMSFIVQLPLASSSRMESVRAVLRQHSNALYVIPFDDRPGKLFEGLQNCRSVIFLSEASHHSEARLFTTGYQRWPTQTRPYLFPRIEYARAFKAELYPGLFPKYATDSEVAIFTKVLEKSDTTIGNVTAQRPTPHFIFYQEATRYWVKATIGLPYYAKDGVVGSPAHGRYVYFDSPQTVAAICAILNGSLFYVYFIAYGDCFHLSDTLVSGFPIPSELSIDQCLANLGERLQTSLAANAEYKTIHTRDGSEITYAEFFVAESKPIIDEIDKALAEHYGFTDEELDFIINYDIKYRMDQDDGDDVP
jgi:Eco57I restriction-modification methylase